MKDITITLSQEEADLVYRQLIGRLDAFDELIKKSAAKSDTGSIIHYAGVKQTLNGVVNKLSAAGARLDI